MINKLIASFNEYWPYTESMKVPYVVEDTGSVYRLIIKNTCEWFKRGGGCTMCNYSHRSGISAEDVIRNCEDNIISAISGLGKHYSKLKLYINGSFFNEHELSAEVAICFLSKLKKIFGIEQVCVETRPEYVNYEKMLHYISETQLRFEICFGIESTNDDIRNKCYHKNLNYSSFVNVYHSISKLCDVKVYLLIKPPFISERDAIEDVVNSVHDLLNEGITSISYTPIAIQKNTLLEFLLQENFYRPVWLWSLIEINSRLSCIHTQYHQIHLSGLDFYPEPLYLFYNCERCSEAVLSLLKEKPNLTWDDIPQELLCSCYDEWKAEIDKPSFHTIDQGIEIAQNLLDKNIKRSIEISKRTNCMKTNLLLTDVAKTSPRYKIKLDHVGIECLKIPLKIEGFYDTIATCDCSISLDEFHRGIHMSRLVEMLNIFSSKIHVDVIADLKNAITVDCSQSVIGFECDLMKKARNKLTNKENYISFKVSCKIEQRHLLHPSSTSTISVTVPFINACPCTRVSVNELFGASYTHTQRGTVCVTFINTTLDFLQIIDYMQGYIGIFDLLKREDEIYVVTQAHDNAQFCEDVCREVSTNILNTFTGHSGNINVRVTTEESIHPHQAYAEKSFCLKN